MFPHNLETNIWRSTADPQQYPPLYTLMNRETSMKPEAEFREATGFVLCLNKNTSTRFHPQVWSGDVMPKPSHLKHTETFRKITSLPHVGTSSSADDVCSSVDGFFLPSPMILVIFFPAPFPTVPVFCSAFVFFFPFPERERASETLYI